MWRTWCRSCGVDIENAADERTEENAMCGGCREYYENYVLDNNGENRYDRGAALGQDASPVVIKPASRG